MATKKRSWVVIIGIGFIVLLIAAFAVFQLAIRELKSQVENALGPQGEIKEIRVGPTGVEVIGIRIRAPKPDAKARTTLAWPAEDQLRAERILIVPSFMDLLSAKVVIRTLRIEGAYISMLRARNGQMKVLPSLLDKPAKPAAPGEKSAVAGEKPAEESMPPITIGRIELADSAIDFYDATIRNPPLKLSMEKINANVSKIRLPELNEKSEINLDGILKGIRQDGRIQINGQIQLSTKESDIATRLRGVDLVALQPYLIKAAETGVRKGALDLDLKTTVKKSKLHGPGTLTLNDLELASGSRTLMGMPRDAVVSMMKNHNDKITVKFVLEGDINDPKFSLNENLSTRVGASVANSLGVSIEDLAKGVGKVGGGTAKGIGESLNKLFGK